MKIKTLVTTAALALATVAVLLWVNPVGAAGGKNPLIVPPNSHAYGNSLTEWLSIYWRWYYSGADMAQSKVGDVQLMPLPVGDLISGSGTPDDPALYRGQLEITIPEGTPFVLPEYAWVGERYEGYPTVPDDVAIPDATLLAGVDPLLTIDGIPVITAANQALYYIPPTPFDPIVVYPTPSSYGSVAAVFFQGVGVVVKPLPVGQHTIKLYEPYIIRADASNPFNFGTIYDNTWHITVTR